MGIGLSISKSIIEAHYGRIWAVSDPCSGTTFSFTLPLTSAEVEE
jgi:signal transduction histidine kinase